MNKQVGHLTAAEEGEIIRFLKLCLADGLYAFQIGGVMYMLESEDDIEKITKAIKAATPPIIQYRLNQARRETKELITRHPALAGA